MAKFHNTYTKNEASTWAYPNFWDAIALILVIGIVLLFAWGAHQMAAPYQLGQPLPISLNPNHLPYYAFRSVLRLLIALVCSTIFTFVVGAIAAKNKHAERLIIPFIDIMQSVPILGFLAITVSGFIALFPGSMLGPECASIFVIFTSQVWNMTLSFYQSLKTVPADLIEASQMFHLGTWQRFWKIDVPFAMPGLLWNMMLSMSASWFFVVASEAISVANQNISLPGIGSYIALAISHADLKAVIYAIIAMLVVILLYDQLLFRPLIAWSAKFHAEEIDEDQYEASSWLIDLFQKTKSFHFVKNSIEKAWELFVNIRWSKPKTRFQAPSAAISKISRGVVFLYYTIILLTAIAAGIFLVRFLMTQVTWRQVIHVFYLGLITGVRVMVLIILSSIIWVPVGVWIGMRGRAAAIAQPIIQFIASFPANLFYPLVVILIVKYNLNVNIWTSPLMILGTQWYILFNVIAGASNLPKDLCQAVNNLHVSGWLKWWRFILPGIFPYFVTGAITAAGGAWNASILAEAVSWGKIHLEATGLGAYISHFTALGDFQKLALGITIMSIYVLVINHLLWRKLYDLAETRYKI